MSFSRILGQERVIEILRRLFASSRFPQALLFWGPQGVGKRSVALELAKTLNCQTQMTADKNLTQMTADKNQTRMHTDIDTDANGNNYQRKSASDFEQSAVISVWDCCDKCLSCQKIEKGLHPDVRVIYPEKESFGIDQIRGLIQEVQWKPLEGEWKIYILEEANKLTQEAANCLLKTLEEPPPRVLLVLLAGNKDVLPPTVVSRCWTLSFSGLSRIAVEKILGKEGKEHLLPLAKIFAGRMQKFVFAEDSAETWREIESFWSNLPTLTGAQLLDLSEKYAQDKEDAERFLTLLLLSARTRESWPAINLIAQAKNYLQRNLNRRLILDSLLLNLNQTFKSNF